jgi:hypothetical protein
MKKITLLILAGFLVALPACKSPTSPENDSSMGTIIGTITISGSGSPVSGATVTTDPGTTTATTGSQGTFTIANVAPKTYTVTAAAPGYASGSVSVTVAAGQTATANISLQADYSGTWSGTTSQGKAISFKVANNAITSISYNFVVGSSSGIFLLFGTISFTGNTFQTSGTIPYTTIQYVIKGTFTSATTANGTGDFTKGTTVVNDTWTATKQ